MVQSEWETNIEEGLSLVENSCSIGDQVLDSKKAEEISQDRAFSIFRGVALRPGFLTAFTIFFYIFSNLPSFHAYLVQL